MVSKPVVLQIDPKNIVRVRVLREAARRPLQHRPGLETKAQISVRIGQLAMVGGTVGVTSKQAAVHLQRLLDLARSMPSDLKVRGTKLKYALKQSLRHVLPDDIIDRKKRGFGAPIGGWFKDELSGYLDSVLSEDRIDQRGIFNWTEIEKIKASHRENREDYTDHLLSMMNFEIWSQMYIDGDSQETVSTRLAEAQVT